MSTMSAAGPSASETVVVNSRPPNPAPSTTTRVFVTSISCGERPGDPPPDLLLYFTSDCDTKRMYGRGARQPFGYTFFASSSETDPAMITSSPGSQLAGVATL
jgi:hypothetical protein